MAMNETTTGLAALPLWSAWVRDCAVPAARFQKNLYDWAAMPMQWMGAGAMQSVAIAPADAPEPHVAAFNSADLPVAALWAIWGWPRVETRLLPATGARPLFEVVLDAGSAPGARDVPAQTAVASRQFEKRPDVVDDLRHLYGVGPRLARLLNGLGVWQFRQVARWTREDVAFFDARLERFRGRIDRDHWIRSAIEEHYKKYGEWLGTGAPGITLPDTDR